MPVEFTPELVAQGAVRLPIYSGHLVRAVVLRMIREIDPLTSATLHEANRPKGYSVTGLYFRSMARTQDAYIVDTSYPCKFKVRFLEDEYAKAFVSYLERNDQITFAKTDFHISRVYLRSISYEAIVSQADRTDAFRMVFRSPTYLASRGSGFHFLFPEPRRLFLHLAKLWNIHAIKLSFADLESYGEWLRGNIGVTGYDLRTRRVKFGGKEAIGFTGWVNFRMKDRGNWNEVTCALGKFAELSNVGANRTGGFGVVTFQPKFENCSLDS